MIARLFSIGVKRLFLIVHRLILQHGHAREVIRISNKWVVIDPAEWRKRYDLRIAVGLGTGTKEGQIQQLGQLFAAQMQTLPLGISTPPNIYHTLVEMAKASGFAGSERFFTDPTTQPPPQHPPPPEVIVEQMKQQGSAQSKQADLQANQQTQQLRVSYDKWAKEQDLEKYKIDEDNKTKLMAEQMKINGSKEVKAMDMPDPMKEMEDEMINKQAMDAVNAVGQHSQTQAQAMQAMVEAMTQAAQAMVQAAQALSAPRVVVRDKSGRVAGTQIAQSPTVQ
jgi:hypothetical protein